MAQQTITALLRQPRGRHRTPSTKLAEAGITRTSIQLLPEQDRQPRFGSRLSL